MNIATLLILKILRKLYNKIFGTYKLPALHREEDPDKASEMIYNLLASDKPCMIARFGSTEMLALVNFLGVNSKKHSVLNYIKGKQPEWWWNKNVMNQMQQWSGFFPPTPENMQKFGDLMIHDTKEVDLLGSWLLNEYYVDCYLPNASKVNLLLLEPFWSQKPWTRVLEGKKVLVIHPFTETIQQQYQKRKFLFSNSEILPDFKLITIRAVQSLGGTEQFTDWFEALNWMQDEMDKIDYDICLIGCGAYGFPLAAHAKRMGKKAVHLGGSLQLLFGIKGNRWENPDFGFKTLKRKGAYTSLFNEYWCKASDNEKIKSSDKVENGCYW